MSIRPKKPSDINFRNTIDMLCKSFNERSSLFNTCWKCLNLEKNEEDYITCAGWVNRDYEDLKLDGLTPAIFKCLVFTQELIAKKKKRLRSNKDSR